jgi:hypothetical protein
MLGEMLCLWQMKWLLFYLIIDSYTTILERYPIDFTNFTIIVFSSTSFTMNQQRSFHLSAYTLCFAFPFRQCWLALGYCMYISVRRNAETYLVSICIIPHSCTVSKAKVQVLVLVKFSLIAQCGCWNS